MQPGRCMLHTCIFWKTKDSFGDSVLILHHMLAGDQMQVIGLAVAGTGPVSHLGGLNF